MRDALVRAIASGALVASCSAVTPATSDGGMDAIDVVRPDVPRADVPGCGVGLSRCGEACVDLQSNGLHCGACGRVCGNNSACQMGECRCATGFEPCADRCVNTQSDPRNCGGCGRACPLVGSICASGVCECPTGWMGCSNTCTNIQNDPRNCGGCGVVCAASGSVCNSGVCECPVGRSECGGACVDRQSDPRNCGACGVTCADTERCVLGACSCPAGSARCGAQCVNVSSDPANCGACGSVCLGRCELGRCAQYSALIAGGNATAAVYDGRVLIAGSVPSTSRMTLAQFDSIARWAPLDSSTLTLGAGHGCVLIGGSVTCSGLDNYAQTGPTFGVFGARSIDAGGFHTCVIDSASVVRCWGANNAGQLGAPASSPLRDPQRALGDVALLSAGSEHTCAVTSGGIVVCWGLNREGQLGDGTRTNSHSPVVVRGPSGTIQSISAGGTVSCATNAAGALFCWGGNDFGELGDGGVLPTGSSRAVSELTQVVEVSAGGNARWSHVCARTSAGEVYCWGANDSGQTGDRGPSVLTTRPSRVLGLPSDIVQISTGISHSCARSATRGILCWGSDRSGQLANGAERGGPVPTAAR